MDRRERYENPQEALRAAQEGHQADIWTALPGIIQDYDPLTKTCSVQPSIQGQITSFTDGSKNWVNMPLLVDCPVYFPSGGGCTLTFPIVNGDECLVVFSSRCIDAWWQSGGVQPQAQMRMHDLSDGFVYVGFSSVPSVQPTISTTSVQLRSNTGETVVDLHPINHMVSITAPGGITITGPLTVNGNIATTGTLTNNTKDVSSTHVHGGVTTGTGNTGAPI